MLTADVAFAPDGRTFATGEPTTGRVSPPPEVIVLRDARTGLAAARTTPIPAGRLAGYTRDGRFLLVVAGDRRSLLLDTRTLRRTRTFPVGGAAALSPAADEAAFAHADGTVTLLNLGTGSSHPLTGQVDGGIDAVSFSHDGRLLATGGENGTVAVWSVRAGALRETYAGHPWNSALYHEPIRADAVGSFRTVMDEATSAAVLTHCQAVFDALRAGT